MSKKELYEGLIRHMNDAVEEAFFLEASWLAYAIIEDRTKRILEVTGVLLKEKATLEVKTKELRKLAKSSDVIAIYLNDDVAPVAANKETGQTLPLAILDALDPWRKKRNQLVHRIADGTIDFEDAAQEVEVLGREGAELAVKFAKVGRQVKKHVKRTDKQKIVEPVISA